MRWLIQAPIQLWLLGCTWKPCDFGAPLFHHISWQQASIFRNPELAGCIAASQVFFSAAVQICGVAGNLVQLPGARIPALEGRTSRVHQCWLVRGVRCIMQISVLVERLMPSMFRCWFLARTHMAFFISLCRSGCCMDRSRRKRLNLCLGKTSHAVALSTSIVNLPPCIYGLGAGSLLHAPAVKKVSMLQNFPISLSNIALREGLLVVSCNDAVTLCRTPWWGFSIDLLASEGPSFLLNFMYETKSMTSYLWHHSISVFS